MASPLRGYRWVAHIFPRRRFGRRPLPRVPCVRLLAAVRGATAPQRVGEPAWHRRDRRRRAAARTLLRVAAASRLLNDQHSAQRGQRAPCSLRDAMPNGRQGGHVGGNRGGDGAGGRTGSSGGGGGGGIRGGGNGVVPKPWDCTVCGIPGNWASRWRCRECDAYGPRGPPPSSQRGGGDFRSGGKGGGRGGAAGGGTTGAAASPTFAQRQLQRQQQEAREQRQQQQQQQRSAAAEKRRADDLQAEVARLQRELAARANCTDHSADPEDVDFDDMDTAENKFSSWTEEERQRQVEVVRGGIPYLESRFGVDSEEVEAAREEVEALLRASREAKPYRTHRGQLERRKSRLDAQQERDKEQLEQIQAEISDAQERLAKVQASIDDRAKLIDKVDAELKELLRKALAEDGDPPAAPSATAAGVAAKAEAWSTVEATLSDMATNAGLPAEQAQQMASFLALFRQVATNVLASPGGSSLATPPACGPRWANCAARKSTTPSATTGTTQAGGNAHGMATGTTSTTQSSSSCSSPGKTDEQVQPQPPTPVVPQPQTPSHAGLAAMPNVLAPHQHSPSRQHQRTMGDRSAEGERDGNANRRQRSSSCSREARKAEAAKSAQEGNERAGGSRGQGTGGGEGAGSAGDAGGAIPASGQDRQGGDGWMDDGRVATVQIGTEDSDADATDTDVGLLSDDGATGVADIDMDVREGETERERKSRISKYFKDRLEARAAKAKKAKEERRKAARARHGVRVSRKGD